MWSTIRDVLKRVIGNNLDYRDARDLKQKLDTVTSSYWSTDKEHINEILNIFEEEGFSAIVIFSWFIEALEDRHVNQPGLTNAIKIRISPDVGPVLKKP